MAEDGADDAESKSEPETDSSGTLSDPSRTPSVIRRMEKKVSAQLKRAKDSVVLAFTGGFSFKHGDEPKIIGRRSPTERREQTGNPFGGVIVWVLVVAIVGGVLGWLVHQERSKLPVEGPLIFDGPK